MKLLCSHCTSTENDQYEYHISSQCSCYIPPKEAERVVWLTTAHVPLLNDAPPLQARGLYDTNVASQLTYGGCAGHIAVTCWFTYASHDLCLQCTLKHGGCAGHFAVICKVCKRLRARSRSLFEDQLDSRPKKACLLVPSSPRRPACQLVSSFPLPFSLRPKGIEGAQRRAILCEPCPLSLGPNGTRGPKGQWCEPGLVPCFSDRRQ